MPATRFLYQPPTPVTPLRQRLTEDMQVRHLAPNTQAAYLQQVAAFARYFGLSPDPLGPEQVRAYQVSLRNDKRVSSSTLSTVAPALRFLYPVTLRRDWRVEAIPRPQREQRLPVVLSADEVAVFLRSIDNLVHRTLLVTAYATGLRVAEATRLRLSDIDSQRMVLRVEQGKGRQDRSVMLSPMLLEMLRGYGKKVRPTDWLFPGLFAGTHLSVCERHNRNGSSAKLVDQ